MKNLFVLLFTLFILTYESNSVFAQGTSRDDAIWSIVKVDPNSPPKSETPYWVPAEPIVRYFDLGDGVTVYPNFRPKPATNSTQSEMSVDVHPANNSIIFCSANASDWPVTTIYGTGVYWSYDGSTIWAGTDNPGTIPGFGYNSGDPVSVIGADGRLYENYISDPGGQGVSVSTNNGANWTSYTVAPNPGSLADKNHFMVDKTPSSPFLHRAYCVWTDFGGTNNYDAVVRSSTNFGQTWSSSINLSNGLASYLNQGANVQTGPNGEVYSTWTVYIGSSVNDGEDGIGFAKSTDGGVTWSAPIYVYQATNFGIRTTSLPGKGIRCNSFPSMAVDKSGGPDNGTIYITWAQRGVAPAGSDPDVVFVKSTDGGTTWTTPVRVNDDPMNNGKDQILPWCTVDQANGQLLFVFYDSRNVANSQAEVFMARSVNGGATFDNFVVSDQAFVLDPISGFSGNYAGDYIGVAAYDDVAYPFWMDERTGNAQGWMAKVEFGPPCPIDPPSNPSPANGSIDLPITGNTASWNNGAGANQIEIWIGQGTSLNMVYSGAPVTSFPLVPVEPLQYNTFYGWQIKGKNDTCTVAGPIWTFRTMQDPNLVIDTLFCEAFEGGLSSWTVTNNGGTSGCIWQIRLSPFPNAYTLPPTATGGIMTADVDDCGSGTTLLSTATLNQTFDLSLYTTMVWIEFDNDWNILDTQDEAHVEVSTNGGTTWIGVWDKIGSDIRNSHEVVDITSVVSGQSNIKFRLRSVQPGWDWWWVLDNFCIYGMYVIPPANTFQLTVNVTLGWNMVSAPGLHPTDQNVATWWPHKTGTVWGFNGTQYVARTVTTPGEGYWMKNTVAETYDYPAIQIVPHDPIPATLGWNLLGGYETSPTITALKAANPQITGTVWGFNGSQYVSATNLVPGYSYWVKVTTAGNITIPDALAKGNEVVELFKEDWGRIILTDAAGLSYTLYSVKGEVDLDQYEMPPMPPSGSFDIRYSSGRIAEDINSSMQTIDMVGITYPLTVRVEGMDIRLQDATGKALNQNLKSGEDVVISDATIQKLMVSGESIPTVYALEQNYPNPFNPSTMIEFSLPEDVGNVKLSIYNALGEKVAELVNTSLQAGKYQYQWNAQNVATGMYIYELRTDKFVSVKKMILLK